MPLSITIGDYTGTVPVNDNDLTLGQRIEFERAYGSDIAAAMQRIKEIGEDKTLTDEERTAKLDGELYEHRINMACWTVEFFAKIPGEVVQNTDIYSLLNVYEPVDDMIERIMGRQCIETYYMFEGEFWEIAPPFLDFKSKMTVGEFVTAKQIIKEYNALQKNRMESLLPLCAIYFRKAGEAFDEDNLIEGSDRWEQMKRLPLSYAMDVAFFLTSSMNLLEKTLTRLKDLQESET